MARSSSSTTSILSERRQQLVISDWDRLKLLDNEENRMVRQCSKRQTSSVLVQDSATIALAVSCDCQFLASSHLSHRILIYRIVPTGSPRHHKILTHHTRTPWCLSFSPSSPSVLLSGCLAGLVCCWDVTSGSCLMSSWQYYQQCPITSISFPTSCTILVTVHNKLILMNSQLDVHWETTSEHEERKIRMALPHTNGGLLVAVNNDSSYSPPVTTCSVLLLLATADVSHPPDLTNGSLVCGSSRLYGPQSIATNDHLLICNYYMKQQQQQCIGVFSMRLECLGDLLYSISLTDFVPDIPRHVCVVSYELLHSHIVLGVGKYQQQQQHYHNVDTSSGSSNMQLGQRHVQCLIMKLQYTNGRLQFKLAAVLSSSTHHPAAGSSCNTAIVLPVNAPTTGVCIGTQAGHVILWHGT